MSLQYEKKRWSNDNLKSISSLISGGTLGTALSSLHVTRTVSQNRINKGRPVSALMFNCSFLLVPHGSVVKMGATYQSL
ncbi:hypothetical protein XELAEV_18034904mg [Xenopus laevis]|uniref:Uncharacterized protein n=1 Tax=Xenopus laevis TaxID=8355 RepID=A0A974HBY4_XENLA|nr:hypothetical protein XELAEV_18034904mg [Xenopus laevis]